MFSTLLSKGGIPHGLDWNYVRIFGTFLILFTNACTKTDTTAATLKAGIIGLDAHALKWTGVLNDAAASGELCGVKVVAGYPGGSPDIEHSVKVLPERIEKIRKLGVEIVDSIDELLKKVDVVMVLSIDGRAHLQQTRPVFEAGKPVFIDKPIAASLADAMEIFRLAEKHNVPCFSSSSLRFAKGTIELREQSKVWVATDPHEDIHKPPWPAKWLGSRPQLTPLLRHAP